MPNNPDRSRSMINMKDGGEIIALNCPNCGAGVSFGQGGCAHCGSGLMRKLGEGKKRFNIPNDAKEIKKENGLEHMDLDSLLEQVVGNFKNQDECAFVMWRGVPVFVGKGIEPEEAIVNWRETRKAIEREDLGDKWVNATKKFGGLLRDMESMPIENRVALGRQYQDSFGRDAHMIPEVRGFFVKPDLPIAEEVMMLFPKDGDEADLLMKFVSKIRGYIPESK